MPFDWATFGLEILNFLVLVWLLARFLYRPIIGAIAKRKAEIADTVAVAQAKEAEAHALARQYEERLASWEREKAQACSALQAEIEVERNRRMAAQNAALGRERQQALVEREAQVRARELERAALRQGAGFASRLLAAFASSELQSRIVEMTCKELTQLPAERRATLQSVLTDGAKCVVTGASRWTNRSAATSGRSCAQGREICQCASFAPISRSLQECASKWGLGS